MVAPGGLAANGEGGLRSAGQGPGGDAARPNDSGRTRAACLSALILCCTAMVVAVRAPSPGPLGMYAASVIAGVVGSGGFWPALGMVALLLWPLWVYLSAPRGWHHVLIAVQILLHLGLLGCVLLRTSPGQRDAVLLTCLPLAMAITFTLQDVLSTIEASGDGRP